MVNGPQVSIVTPCFNRDRLIGDTLRSCLAQTYRNWECLVVDDGSTDDSVKIVKAAQSQDKRIQLIERDRLPKGAATCRNLGLEQARGEYVVFLDSDDLLAPYCLEERVTEFETDKDRSFVVFPMLYFVVRPLDDTELVARESENDHLTRFLQYDFPWTITGPIWKKSDLAGRLGGLNEKSLGGGQDWELHVRALAAGLRYSVKSDSLPDCFLRSHREGRISNTVSEDMIGARKGLFEETLSFLFERIDLTETQRLGLSGAFLQTVSEPMLAFDRDGAIQAFRDFFQRMRLEERRLRRVELFLSIPWEKVPFPVVKRATRRVLLAEFLPRITTVKHASRADLDMMRTKAMEAGSTGVGWAGRT